VILVVDFPFLIFGWIWTNMDEVDGGEIFVPRAYAVRL
jgi:hypothetical protein